jgi:hypothetical protein
MEWSAIWEFESRNNGQLPEQIEQASELQALSNDLIIKAKVNKKFLAESSKELFEYALVCRKCNVVSKSGLDH